MGEGSTFRFELSLPNDPNGAPAPRPRADLKNVRVLIADDNEVSRRVLEEQIDSWGMKSFRCASSQEALHALRDAIRDGDPFQIAVIDYEMPGIDEPTLAREIKSDATLADTVLVMLSSIGRGGGAERMTKAGFAGYVNKPVHQSQLLEVLALAWTKHLGGQDSGLVSSHTDPVAESVLPREPPSQRSGGTIRVLVAEDNIVNQQVASLLLEKFGCHVDVAANGQAAVEMAGKFPYTLILMDCLMPIMAGIEATSSIRATDKHTPIIALTASATQEDRERCLAAGMDDYLTKPVNPQALREAIDKWSQQTAQL